MSSISNTQTDAGDLPAVHPVLIEPFGMDECWLDVSDSQIIRGDPMTIAEDIRSATREELGLTVSIGVSYNKIFAKLGSDMKKPDAITEITVKFQSLTRFPQAT